jgi:hypothetical protein
MLVIIKVLAIIRRAEGLTHRTHSPLMMSAVFNYETLPTSRLCRGPSVDSTPVLREHYADGITD